MNQAMAVQDNLDLARRLVDAIESGDRACTNDLIHALNDGRFDALFKEIGKLTRGLHDTLRNLAADDRLVSLAREQMPDARARLRYVIDKTEEAADRTLTAVETMIPTSDQLVRGAEQLKHELGHAQDAEVLRLRTHDFLDSVVFNGRKLRSGLTDVLMAQEYQDLTGQVIKRTIDLVNQVEEQLVGLVTACGAVTMGAAPLARAEPPTRSQGPVMRSEDNVVSRQADVDELLANLGF